MYEPYFHVLQRGRTLVWEVIKSVKTSQLAAQTSSNVDLEAHCESLGISRSISVIYKNTALPWSTIVPLRLQAMYTAFFLADTVASLQKEQTPPLCTERRKCKQGIRKREDRELTRQHKSIPFCLETSWIIRDEMNTGSNISILFVRLAFENKSLSLEAKKTNIRLWSKSTRTHQSTHTILQTAIH